MMLFDLCLGYEYGYGYGDFYGGYLDYYEDYFGPYEELGFAEAEFSRSARGGRGMSGESDVMTDVTQDHENSIGE